MSYIQPPSGASSSSLNLVQAIVDFGDDSGPITLNYNASVVVAAPWVTSSSIVIVTPTGKATSNHGVLDALLEGLIATVNNLNPGVGFTVTVYSPLGSFGMYYFNAVGA